MCIFLPTMKKLIKIGRMSHPTAVLSQTNSPGLVAFFHSKQSSLLARAPMIVGGA